MSRKLILGAWLALAWANGSAMAQSRLTPVYKLDATGTNIIALSRLSTATGCATASGTGRVTERHFEQGVLRGISFKADKYGDSYINLLDPNEIADPDLRRRVNIALNSLLSVGARLKLGTLGCGAAGRIEKLASVELIGPPKTATGAVSGAESAAAPAVPGEPLKPTKWRVSQPTKVQFDIAIASTDRAGSWSITCMRDVDRRVHFSNWLVGSRSWAPDARSRIAIDGVAMRWEIDGADEGVSLSDSMQGNASTLSPNARTNIARGKRLVITGLGNRDRPREAIFDISGGEAAFASFEAKCETLPQR